MRRAVGSVVTVLMCCGLDIAAAGDVRPIDAGPSSAQPSHPPQGAADASGTPAGADASSVLLPCIPVAAYWTGPPQSEGMPPGPELAVVSADIRPKDARLYLDDRFVGRTRYLDGRPGYLYLTPGTYHLELRLDGYETLAVKLEAEAGCRFDLKHRLQRVKGTAKENASDGYGEGKPFNRVYSPLNDPSTADRSVRGHAAGPDPALRPDLGLKTSQRTVRPPTGAALKLNVSPASAAIAIDGEFVATATELDRMEGPLAVSAGSHVIEITAPGHRAVSRDIELDPGEVVEISVALPAGVGDQK